MLHLGWDRLSINHENLFYKAQDKQVLHMFLLLMSSYVFWALQADIHRRQRPCSTILSFLTCGILLTVPTIKSSAVHPEPSLPLSLERRTWLCCLVINSEYVLLKAIKLGENVLKHFENEAALSNLFSPTLASSSLLHHIDRVPGLNTPGEEGSVLAHVGG